MARKILPRKRERSPLLASEAERTERVDALRATFLSWFESVPGAEWELASTDGMLLYCYWYANDEHPEWGKVFMAYRLDQPIERMMRAVDGREDPGAHLPKEAEWLILGLDPANVTREQVIDAYARQHAAATDERNRRLCTAAYGRILNELWFRQHHSDGRKKE